MTMLEKTINLLNGLPDSTVENVISTLSIPALLPQQNKDHALSLFHCLKSIVHVLCHLIPNSPAIPVISNTSMTFSLTWMIESFPPFPFNFIYKFLTHRSPALEI